MGRYLLSLAYRVTSSPFAAWALLALTLASLTTAILKTLCWIAIPAALRPDTLRSVFQLAPFAFIPLAIFLGLTQYRWRLMRERRHRIFSWSLSRCALAFACWLLLLIGLFGFNLVAFPH